ncbi:MAG: lamin tail domain-containing protein [Methanothrix sp.]|jgi:hypothetical protein|nr:lamin tail domain-containing protein [Methanothrix sp.]NLX39146.1 lamin tail domain-containing protein [Methanothrix sp.]OPX78230.1 MAG: hypothetical protein A4E50_02268 [Methanosaeta sp. PtaB.Bin087]HPY72344.1 lamin tail domain-containing protein [Methanothrix sp.]
MRIASGILASLSIVVALSAIGAGSVVINEVELNPTGNATKWAELYNGGDEAVEISGWVVTIVNLPWSGMIVVPDETVIPAGGYYVAEGDPQWSQDYQGSVTLVDGMRMKVDESPLIVDDGDSDFTYGRYPNGLDTDQRTDWKLMKATPRAENALS